MLSRFRVQLGPPAACRCADMQKACREHAESSSLAGMVQEWEVQSLRFPWHTPQDQTGQHSNSYSPAELSCQPLPSPQCCLLMKSFWPAGHAADGLSLPCHPGLSLSCPPGLPPAPSPPWGAALLRSVFHKCNQEKEPERCYDSNKSVSCSVSTLEKLV